MNVLIADSFESSGLKELQDALGASRVRMDSTLKGDALVKAVGTCNVLVVRSTKVPREVIEAAGALSLIVRAGAGTENIDTAAASERGIFVANCPGKNAIAVAELTMGLILALDRRIPDNVIDLRAGKWSKKEFSKADGLAGKTLGLVGLGSIGQAVATRARAFGLNVIAWSRSLTAGRAAEMGVGYASNLKELARNSNILSLHVAGGPSTQNLIDADVLAQLPQKAMFINTARASSVDAAALRAAIQTKGLRVAMDVFPDEPGANDTEFKGDWAGLPGFIGTHHIGASTEQAQKAIAAEAVRVILRYADTGEVDNTVNLCRKTPAQVQLIVRHYDRVGVLADVLNTIRTSGINVQAMSNIIFDGAAAACAKIELEIKPDAATIEKVKASNPAIIHVECASIAAR